MDGHGVADALADLVLHVGAPLAARLSPVIKTSEPGSPHRFSGLDHRHQSELTASRAALSELAARLSPVIKTSEPGSPHRFSGLDQGVRVALAPTTLELSTPPDRE